MTSKTTRYTLFLLAAVVAADSGPDGVSIDKKHRLDRILAARFPELSGQERWALLARAMAKLPPISSGIDFVRLVERSSRKITELEPDAARRRRIHALMHDLASSDGALSPHEALVLQAAQTHLRL